MGMSARAWVTREAAVAALAAAGIAAHLALRAFPGLPPLSKTAPLLAVLAVGGVPLTAKIARKLMARDLGADLLAAISLVAAAAMGQYLVAAILVLMLSGGEALELMASRRASSVLEALARRSPQLAHRRGGDLLEDLPVADVRIGDRLVVLPHELCPVDGVVVEGRGVMDESYLTGEPFRIAKAPGSQVLSGAVNGDAALTIRADKLAADSRYASIMKVMERSQLSRPALRRLGDQLAVLYIPLTLALAVLAGAAARSPERFLSVLVVATPCPLLIAVPVAVIGAISLAAGRGIIVKDPTVLERVARCRTIILDKTGTLTFGKPSLTEVSTLGGAGADETLRLAAGLERYSRHPLASAVLDGANERGLAPAEATDVAERPGEGLVGTVEGRHVQVGGRKLAPGAALPPQAPGLECLVAVDGRPAALLRFRDAPRPESRSFLRHLRPTHGVGKIMLVSGDRASEVAHLAETVGIAEVVAEATPELKVEIVRAEAAKAETLFVGDGINDAPALAAATVGVAMGQASDITSAAAGAVILTPSIGKLDELIHVGARMRSIALQSAVGGMALAFVGMALAACGRLTPVEGAIAQELIDLLAVLNAVRVAFWPGRLRDY
jgi:heavy metal translocating P-type ATPase